MSGDHGWLTARQRNGGIDEIPLPDGVPGSLSLCGKHAIAPELGVVSGNPADGSLRSHSLRMDPPQRSVASRRSAHAPGTTLDWTTVVCLTERHELEERYPDYVRWLDQGGDRSLWWPIPDMHAPPVDAMLGFADDLAGRLRRGDSLLVHCGAGIGRAGTVAACVLIRLGVSADEAVRIVREHRPMAGPEVGAQCDLVRAIGVIA